MGHLLLPATKREVSCRLSLLLLAKNETILKYSTCADFARVRSFGDVAFMMLSQLVSITVCMGQ